MARFRAAHAIRRVGRIGIAFLSAAVGFIVFGVTSKMAAAVLPADDFAIHMALKVCGTCGFVTAVATFAFVDRHGLLPDDSDPPTTLSLTGDLTPSETDQWRIRATDEDGRRIAS